MKRQSRATKMKKLLNSIRITSHCHNCPSHLLLHFLKNKFFLLSIPTKEKMSLEENNEHKSTIISSGKQLSPLQDRQQQTSKIKTTYPKIRKKRSRWGKEQQLLLRGCLKLFGNDLEAIHLIIPEFNFNFLTKKIKALEWKNLYTNNEEYVQLAKFKEKVVAINTEKVTTRNSLDFQKPVEEFTDAFTDQDKRLFTKITPIRRKMDNSVSPLANLISEKSEGYGNSENKMFDSLVEKKKKRGLFSDLDFKVYGKRVFGTPNSLIDRSSYIEYNSFNNDETGGKDEENIFY